MISIKAILRTEDGIALMLTLWVMVFLIIVATQFALSSRTEVVVVSNYVEEAKCYYLAKAGISYAIAEIMNTENEYTYLDTKTNKIMFGRTDKEKAFEEDGKEKINPNKEDMEFGGGLISYTIEDEGGKIPLNIIAERKSIQQFQKLLELIGMEEGEERDIVIDSIIDWVDKDDLHGLQGAENDYYNSLDPSYDCKNGRIDLPEEMLLIKGVTPEILKKLMPLVTVFNNNQSEFNQNTASCEVYKIWNNYEEDARDKCLERFDEEGNPKDKKMSTVYSIISTGKSKDGIIRRTVKAVIKRFKSGKDKMSLKYLFWDDNFIPSEEEKTIKDSKETTNQEVV